MTASIGAVVMAAGAGNRMGHRPKSLLLRDGEPLLLRQVRLLALASAAPIVVVLGHHQDALLKVLQAAQTPFPQLHWTTNPAPDDGPASSLRCGLAALPEALDTIIVTLGDLPLVQAGDTETLLAAWQQRAAPIALVLPVHEQTPGHPLAFGTVVRAAVMQGSTVRDWRRAHADQVQTLRVNHDRCTTDVDTPQALERLAREHNVELSWLA